RVGNQVPLIAARRRLLRAAAWGGGTARLRGRARQSDSSRLRSELMFANRKELSMTSLVGGLVGALTGSSTTLRCRLFGILTATALGGTAAVVLAAPSAVG